MNFFKKEALALAFFIFAAHPLQARTLKAAPLTTTAELSVSSTAATVAIQGRISQLGTRDALAGASVEVLGLSISAQSDALGHYALQAPAGKQTLRFSADDFSPRKKVVTLAEGKPLHLDMGLESAAFEADEIVIPGFQYRPEVVTTTLSQEEIKRIPGTGGDALRALQNLPGIAVPDDYSSQLIIQGGNDSDNLYLIDNIPWPFPFHFGGIVSTVNSELLQSIDLNAAGFGARWGNALGAVLEGHTRPPKSDRIHGTIDVSLIMSQLMIEGPLGLGNATVTLAGRRSYLDLVLKHLDTGSSFTALPVFWDLGATLDFTLGPDNSFHFLTLSNDDVLGLLVTAEEAPNPNFVGTFSLDNSASTTGLRWTNTSWRNLRSVLTPYYYDVSVDDNLGTGFSINNSNKVLGIKEEAVWTPTGPQEISFGGSVEGVDNSTLVYIFDKNFNNTSGLPAVPVSSTISTQSINRAAYISDRLQLAKPLALTAGLHYDKSDLVAGDFVTPRLNLELKTGPQTTWKAAWGLYDEFPNGRQLNPDYGNPSLDANRAEHSVLSVEQDLGRGRSLRLDGYYKTYYNLVVSDPNAGNVSQGGTYTNGGLGDARGVELLLRQDIGERFFGWLAYAYSKSERFGPPSNDWSPYQYDQTNIATLLGSYRITPDWGLGAKLHYNTGPLVQSYLYRYQDSSGLWHGVFSNDYDQRLDDYLRLDLRMDYDFHMQGWSLNTYVEVLNVLGRPNPQSLNYPKDYSTPPQQVNDLPRFPYFGFEADF